MTFSSGGGGTMFVPSPTHVGHGDVSVSSAVRNLRRSLSRSPSKFNMTGKTTPPIPPDDVQDSGNTNSPQSPSLRYSPALAPPEKQQAQTHNTHQIERQRERLTATPSQRQQQPTYTPATNPPSVFVQSVPENQTGPFATPLRPKVKLSLRSAKSSKPLSSTPSRLPARPRASPRSPLKRALSTSSDSGNSAPSSSGSTDNESEKNKNLAVPTSPLQRRHLGKQSRPHSLHIDVSGASHSMFRALNTPDHPGTPSGTLKRSDANMDLDTESIASPVAKRRSLHGISTLSHGSHEPSIFENAMSTSASTHFDIYDESVNQEYQLTGSMAPSSTATPSIFRRDPLPSPTPNPGMPRRSSSLRKSTLQQRHGDKGSWGRRAGVQQLAQMGEASTPIARNNRPRLSLDQFIPPILPNESPFTAARPLPNPSVHNMDRPMGQQPHPLSRSVKVSGSGNRLLEDTSMKPPAARMPNPQTAPFQSFRSFASRSVMSEMGPSGGATSTPQSNQEPGRMFMSTGLVSKMHFHPDDDKRPVIPETPSKKPHGTFGTYPPGSHGTGRRDTGSPVAKFADRGRDSFGGSGRGLTLFQKLGASCHLRRGSVLGFDDEGKGSEAREILLASDSEIPPTPTKVLFTPAGPSIRKYTIESPTANRRVPLSAVRPTHPDMVRESSSSPILGETSPATPQESQDKSRASPGHLKVESARSENTIPVTPTSTNGRRLVTPVHARNRIELDEFLLGKFSRVEPIGGGEFSTVFKVAYAKQHRSSIGADFGNSVQGTPQGNPPPGKAFAIKKVRRPFAGARDREIKLREVRILSSLRFAPHIIQLVDSWEVDGHLYMQTEFCDEGSLDVFLAKNGRDGRLDDFRIWKILEDVSLGIREIHRHGFLHLDLKPANIFITHEGVLKIGDFGLATEWPAKEGIDAEGDREYIAAEILAGQVDKAADIFALGITVLEMAANVTLPSNGPSWQALRSSDFRLVPALTYPSMSSTASLTFEGALSNVNKPPQGPRGEFGLPRNHPLLHPPLFMCMTDHPSSLDQVVAWMMAADPRLRPAVDQILSVEALAWVGHRRRLPAAIYEGMWGPDDAVVLASDIACGLVAYGTDEPYGADGDTVMTGI